MDFFEKLAYLKRTSPSTDVLQLLGKQAAGRFISKDCDNITEAVSQVVNEGDYNKDQIERISQFANQAAWKTLFIENGETGTDFEPASFSSVSESLDSSPEVVENTNMSDYLNDANESWRDEGDLEDLFKVSNQKEYPKLDPYREAVEAYEKTASAVSVTQYSLDTSDLLIREVAENFYNMVKQAHIRDGHGILQLANAVSQVTGSEKWASAVMTNCADKLAKEGIKISKDEELKKIANPVIINSDHEFLTEAAKFHKLAMAWKKSKIKNSKAKKEKNKKLKELKDKLRSA